MPTFQSFDGTRLSYEVEGDGFPVVLIHGFATDSFVNWVRPGLVDRLRGRGFKVVLFDMHGEYLKAFSDDAGNPLSNVTYLSDRNLVLPYWMLAFEEFEQIFIDTHNPENVNAQRLFLREAFEKLDFYVYTGLFMEEAAYFADIILPVCSGLEMEGVYMRRDDRGIRWQDQAVQRVGGSRPDWEIWIDLAHALEEVDTSSPRGYWSDAFPTEWKDYRTLWSQFVDHTPGMKGMSAERMRARNEPLRWPCPNTEHPGVSTLYMDHPSWYEAAESLGGGNEGKRFLTPSGKVEIHTEELEESLRTVGHSALPVFYTHPEVTGRNPTIEYTDEFVTNPLYPHATTPKVRLGVKGGASVHKDYPLMGMTGRPSVAHFASVTQWTPTGKRLNGVRLVQIHPRTARDNGIAEGDEVRVESPRGAVTGTALLWDGIREDTIFVPSTFGPAQVVGDVSGATRYESANLLVSDRYFDNVSGQQAYKCFACRVTKA